MAGIVCPTVDAWVEAAKIDLYSPGTGSAVRSCAREYTPNA